MTSSCRSGRSARSRCARRAFRFPRRRSRPVATPTRCSWAPSAIPRTTSLHMTSARTPRALDLAGGTAVNTLPYTRPEVERIAEVAFRLAKGRRKKVTSVDKSNVLETSQLWRSVTTDVGARHPDVVLEHQLVDSCAMNLVLFPP